MVSEAEKQLTNLFKALFFDVHVRRSLQMLKLYEVAQEFAKKITANSIHLSSLSCRFAKIMTFLVLIKRRLALNQ